MKSLIDDMTLDDPTKRPTAQEVVSRFEGIRRGLHFWKLRSRIVRRNEILPVTVWRSSKHLYCTVRYILAKKAAVPKPS